MRLPGPGSSARWSARELETLAAVAETFVPGAGAPTASLAAGVLAAAADPAQLVQLRLVLRILSWRLVNLLLVRRARPFAELSADERERCLLSWGHSHIALRRTAFQALHGVLCFIAYAAPTEDGEPNPRWAAIGYELPERPLTTEPTPIRPADLPPAGIDGRVELEADVVVVGSGAGGGIVAHDLACAGRSVVVLEAGPFLPEPAMPADELDAFDRLYLNHGLTATWDGSIPILAGTGVGGGTVVNWMTCIRAPGTVRGAWARDHGLDGFDGPEADADYASLERELGVRATRSIGPKDAALLRGAAALGIEAAPIRRNGPDCEDCGACGFGCRSGEKASGLRTHLAGAWRAGARIVPDARVERVIVEGGRAVGVEATVEATVEAAVETARGVVGDGGRPVRLAVRARQVVVAAGTLRTPAVLERSGIDHPALGRHLRLHPVCVVAGRYDEPVDMWRGTMQAARSIEYVDGEDGGRAGGSAGGSGGGRNGYVIETAPGHPGLIALAFPWEGRATHVELMERIRFLGPLIGVTRDGGDGRVRLTRAGRVRIDYRLDEAGVRTLRHALVRMARIARAAGAREIVGLGTPPAWWRGDGGAGGAAGGVGGAFAAFEERLASFDFGPNRGRIFSAHQMGTARMGADPTDHVCDPYGRVRGGPAEGSVVRGLYVADASLFPTGLGVNPMITVMAVARRVGRTVLAEG